MPTSAVSGGFSPSGNAPSGVTGTSGGSGFGFSVAPGTFGQVGSVAASSPGLFGNPPTVTPTADGGHLGFMYGENPGLLGDGGGYMGPFGLDFGSDTANSLAHFVSDFGILPMVFNLISELGPQNAIVVPDAQKGIATLPPSTIQGTLSPTPPAGLLQTIS
jgi:hypothetical protein